jgi:hypothetical protein
MPDRNSLVFFTTKAPSHQGEEMNLAHSWCLRVLVVKSVVKTPQAFPVNYGGSSTQQMEMGKQDSSP